MNIMKEEESFRKNNNRSRFLPLLKFYLFPGYRNPEFSKQEYEIEKIKSKRRFFRHLLNFLTLLGITIFLVYIFIGIFCPWLTEYPLQSVTPPSMPGAPWLDPNSVHPLGTTRYGYDILARILWGARTSLYMAFIPAFIAVGGGLIVGTISAYFGGKVDYIIMRIVDVVYTLPTLIIILILVRIIGTGMMTILVIYGAFAIAPNTRFMRSN